jgi:hypothetical protein
MKNITVTVTDKAYRQARVWAAERETSVSAVVRYLLQTLPGIQRANAHFPVTKSDSPTPAASSAEAN